MQAYLLVLRRIDARATAAKFRPQQANALDLTFKKTKAPENGALLQLTLLYSGSKGDCHSATRLQLPDNPCLTKALLLDLCHHIGNQPLITCNQQAAAGLRIA